MKLSVIVTAKNINDQKLKDLECSLTQQTFQDFEKIIVTEGDSESAKGIGLRKAKGEIVCILASDNYLNDPCFFSKCLRPFRDKDIIGSFPARYYYDWQDNMLNRYFALFGVNDPIPLYLNKNDRYPYYIPIEDMYSIIELKQVPTLGDNGFFIRQDVLMQADIEHYYHIDVCQDLFDKGYKTYAVVNTSIWHKTGGDIFSFFSKRLKYADKFYHNRRWHMVERKDLLKLSWFILCTLTLIQPLYLSIKGYMVIKDKAWFLHLPICIITIGVYGLWTLKKLIMRYTK